MVIVSGIREKSGISRKFPEIPAYMFRSFGPAFYAALDYSVLSQRFAIFASPAGGKGVPPAIITESKSQHSPNIVPT